MGNKSSTRTLQFRPSRLAPHVATKEVKNRFVARCNTNLPLVFFPLSPPPYYGSYTRSFEPVSLTVICVNIVFPLLARFSPQGLRVEGFFLSRGSGRSNKGPLPLSQQQQQQQQRQQQHQHAAFQGSPWWVQFSEQNVSSVTATTIASGSVGGGGGGWAACGELGAGGLHGGDLVAVGASDGSIRIHGAADVVVMLPPCPAAVKAVSAVDSHTHSLLFGIRQIYFRKVGLVVHFILFMYILSSREEKNGRRICAAD